MPPPDPGSLRDAIVDFPHMQPATGLPAAMTPEELELGAVAAEA